MSNKALVNGLVSSRDFHTSLLLCCTLQVFCSELGPSWEFLFTHNSAIASWNFVWPLFVTPILTFFSSNLEIVPFVTTSFFIFTWPRYVSILVIFDFVRSAVRAAIRITFPAFLIASRSVALFLFIFTYGRTDFQHGARSLFSLEALFPPSCPINTCFLTVFADMLKVTEWWGQVMDHGRKWYGWWAIKRSCLNPSVPSHFGSFSVEPGMNLNATAVA